MEEIMVDSLIGILTLPKTKLGIQTQGPTFMSAKETDEQPAPDKLHVAETTPAEYDPEQKKSVVQPKIAVYIRVDRLPEDIQNAIKNGEYNQGVEVSAEVED